MMYLVIGIVLVTLGIVLLLTNYPLVKVCGNSMYPTFIDGEMLFSKRIFNSKTYQFVVGEIYVFENPLHEEGEEDVYVIKRLCYVTCSGKLFFLGDNREDSCDSRTYGEVNREMVVAKIIESEGEEFWIKLRRKSLRFLQNLLCHN